MGWNWIIIVLMHLQVGMTQLSNVNLDELQTNEPDHAGYGWPTRVFEGKVLTGKYKIIYLIMHDNNIIVNDDKKKILKTKQKNKEFGNFCGIEGLGFRNATKNKCGFCTGGNTNLPKQYYMDCEGKCEGTASSLDCNGDCRGKAYIDECSGECIGGNTKKTEKDVESYRDCRGGCMSSGVKLFKDSCSVCHTGASPFQDCTNRCHMPSQEKQMTKLICGRCVGGTSGIPASDVLDPCGNCKSDGIECPCNGTGKPDACGVCNGGGASCMKVIRFQPRALPVNTKQRSKTTSVDLKMFVSENVQLHLVCQHSVEITFL
ncbi:uncharacterized protein CEXT_398991 [Caerostris extrusa]|uniref:Uncharacterized protein n=1 Tax=Caerostris extrusa TaxID=172846 RepID=A0AAV4MMH7_CAEEX|nr:uncharacterized protein CEXT_398991 [Caerostris extrusa]